ncbi:hypothetical protein SERLA73DRAFT_190579 [Serpula lacrymans var. lacrymans S7.3]|uniref:Glutathione-dependent dehydroascorbate reductase n=2 Tax=Serpula lacrymans var. lacrymans TaxID=341189 RepID=F8QFZ4_SERL3|nr:uncharacterized protein SERLADRAFT_463437 [Serpula lacrymans var. lacrymans S7.9]EGN92742.1 hypothetical protein SERLA73DRAFT_190579 [Serpula lacrymans var. lacrymans S7.3]EGO26403.1 hypothetical protein SERLADRAFT_463437 [Serpula lacrymans var. lacrymans S7.9]
MGIPDEKIHPVATGVAIKTVEKHQEPQELVFYSGWFCPFNQRTWISLEEKGIPYQYKEVNPYKKEKHFLDINPKGLVPAIEYRGKALYESIILCEFLEDAYPSHKPHLLPVDPFDRAHARIWIDHCTKTIVSATHRLLQSQDKESQDNAREELYAAQRKLAKEVKGPYFNGEEFGLVDICVAPWIARDYVVAEHRGYKREDASKEWKEYADRLSQRESVVKTMSEREHLNVIYDRYLRDEAQSEAAKATRAGREIP